MQHDNVVVLGHSQKMTFIQAIVFFFAQLMMTEKENNITGTEYFERIKIVYQDIEE